MTAEQMFKKLGYEKVSPRFSDVEYSFSPDRNTIKGIRFYNGQVYTETLKRGFNDVYYPNGGITMNKGLLKAIKQQMSELRWLD